MNRPSNEKEEFLQHAKSGSTSLIGEYLHMLRTTKKWWLIPIIIALLFVSIFIVLSSTAVAPLIYTLF